MKNAIINRISRRSYEDTPLIKEEQAYIKELTDTLNSHSGLSMEFVEDGSAAFSSIKASYGLFKNIRSLILMKGRKEDQNLCEKIGYYGEDFVLSVTDLNLGTCWVGGTFDKAKFQIAETEKLICVIVVGKTSGVSMKERMIRGAARRKMKPLEERITADRPLPEWVIAGMQAVLLAPSAKNAQKVTFRYENQTVSADIPDHEDMDWVDLGIAKKHFEIEAKGYFDFGGGAIFHKL